jgi:hypothetical protein
MAAVKTAGIPKVDRAAKPKKKAAPKRSGTSGRKYLSPAMLDALIRHSPPHPAVDAGGSDKPPFEPQDD